MEPQLPRPSKRRVLYIGIIIIILIAIIGAVTFILRNYFQDPYALVRSNKNGRLEMNFEGINVVDITSLRDFKIFISDAEVDNIEVQGDTGILRYVDIKQNSNTLTIKPKEKIDPLGIYSPYEVPPGALTFVISINELTQVNFDGEGTLEVRGIIGEELSINSVFRGNSRVNIKDIDFKRLNVSAANGNGGMINISGKAQTAEFNIYDSSIINSLDLTTDVGTIRILKDGSAFLKVENSLTMDIKEDGAVYYLGTPQLFKNPNSIGRVVPLTK